MSERIIMDIPPLPNLLQIRVIHTCKMCRKVFQPKHKLQKYCNTQCRNESRKAARSK